MLYHRHRPRSNTDQNSPQRAVGAKQNATPKLRSIDTVTNDVLPAPPITTKRRSSFALWIFGCCGGCLLFVLILVGIGGFGVMAGIRSWEEGGVAKNQEKVYSEVVANAGAPPGFRLAQSMDFNYLFFSFKGVIFVPVSAEGPLQDVINVAETWIVLFQNPESASGRVERDQLYETGKMKEPPGIVKFIQQYNQSPLQQMDEMDHGTLPGHKYPLRYLIPKIDLEKLQEHRDRRVPKRGDQKPIPISNRPFAMVDLTVPDSKVATQLIVIRTNKEEITPEFLEEICKNFKPGE